VEGKGRGGGGRQELIKIAQHFDLHKLGKKKRKTGQRKKGKFSQHIRLYFPCLPPHHTHTHAHTDTWLHLSIHQSIISGIVHQCHSVSLFCFCSAFFSASFVRFCCPLPILLRFCLAHRRITEQRTKRKGGEGEWRLDGWPEKVSKSKPNTGRMIYFWASAKSAPLHTKFTQGI